MKQDVTDKQGQDLKKMSDQYGGQSKSSTMKKVFQIEVLKCMNLRRADAQYNSAAFNPKMM